MKRAIIISLSAAVAFFGLSFEGIAQTIKLGAVVPLTGRYAALGGQVKAGYEIGVQHIKAAGGVSVSGKKLQIELTMLDDESDPTKTVARLETLATQGVVAYLGGAGSDLHAAAASIGDKNKIPYLGIAFAFHGIHKQGLRYLFSPFPKSPDLTTETFVFLDAMIPAAQRPRKVALFLERTDWGKEMGSLWESTAKKHGYQIVASGEYAPGSKDFSDLILKAKSAGSETVLALPSPPDGMTIVKQMKELDFNPKVQVFIRAADPPVWAQNLSKDGDYVLLSPGWHFAVKYPKVTELNESHQKLFNRPADPIVGPSYACIQILANAIEHAGGLDREKIRAAVAATNMTTVVGPVKFRSDGTGEVKVFFQQWLKGKQELVWPKEFATAAFGYPAPPFSQR
ncbi:MAG TPA: amino acid ABC transporter substrate-binding protein [Candidatus Binatia bacterium]|jgi:branched-chain amino acid transport system substrate-binding protein|nr:amino acid ABC transporter substrate-binding protein [Candidatus Binatia bacterium]